MASQFGGKVAAGFVIFRRAQSEIQYLMMQTSYGEHHWTPPKGHVDPGETDELVTAYRETLEESGLRKGDLKVYAESKQELKYDVKGSSKIVIYWLAELINPQAKVVMSDEHQDFKWLVFEEACKYGKYSDMQSLLKYYNEFLLKTK